MAGRDSTIADCSDRIDETTGVLLAIIDVAMVLAALERADATANREESLQTGHGFASGFTLSDSTLPNLLAHGKTLFASLKEDTESLAAAASARRLAEVGHG